MRKKIGPALSTAAAGVMLTACAQPPTPPHALPPGPTPQEAADFARAQERYRSALISGNDDVVMQATYTFSAISGEILSRQDPRLFDAQVVCEGYRVAGSRDRPDKRMRYELRFVQDCESIQWRYNQATMAIRRELEASIATADAAILAQAEVGRP
jgi:hypothetical protein